MLPVFRPFAEVSTQEIEEFMAASTPANTRISTNTAVNLYNSWRSWKIASHPSRQKPPELLSMDYGRLPAAISQFFCEIRKFDSKSYRADTIKTYFASIGRALKDKDPSMKINENPRFAKTVKTVDGLVRNLRKTEDPKKRQAETITTEHEKELKKQGLLGTETPKSLLNTILYTCGNLFGLRGGKELRKVRWSQFQFENIEPGRVKVIFHDAISKTNHAGLHGSTSSGKNYDLLFVTC